MVSSICFLIYNVVPFFCLLVIQHVMSDSDLALLLSYQKRFTTLAKTNRDPFLSDCNICPKKLETNFSAFWVKLIWSSIGKRAVHLFFQAFICSVSEFNPSSPVGCGRQDPVSQPSSLQGGRLRADSSRNQSTASSPREVIIPSAHFWCSFVHSPVLGLLMQKRYLRAAESRGGKPAMIWKGLECLTCV